MSGWYWAGFAVLLAVWMVGALLWADSRRQNRRRAERLAFRRFTGQAVALPPPSKRVPDHMMAGLLSAQARTEER